MENIISSILSSVNNENEVTKIMELKKGKKKNELLCFLKPETFFPKNEETIKNLINISLEKFKEYEVDICGITQVSGPILAKYEIMDKHYGFINTVSKNASKMLSFEDKKEICKLLNIDFNNNISFYGGHEFLADYPSFDSDSLNKLWLTKESIKLKSGFYFQSYDIEGKTIILIDAFHPSQLDYYTKAGRNIILISLSSDKDWSSLRDDMVGLTFPDKASFTSIRGEIFSKKDEFGLEDVSISTNFCHLSAGAFEAMFEMNNFYSNIIDNFDLSNTNLFKKLEEKGLNKEEILESLNNPSDLFDTTEHLNTSEALEVYISKYKG